MFDKMLMIVTGSVKELVWIQEQFDGFQQFYTDDKTFNEIVLTITDYLDIARDIRARCMKPANQTQSRNMTVAKWKFAALGELKGGDEQWFNTMNASLQEAKTQNFCAEKETDAWVSNSSRTITECVARPYPYKQVFLELEEMTEEVTQLDFCFYNCMKPLYKTRECDAFVHTAPGTKCYQIK